MVINIQEFLNKYILKVSLPANAISVNHPLYNIEDTVIFNNTIDISLFEKLPYNIEIADSLSEQRLFIYLCMVVLFKDDEFIPKRKRILKLTWELYDINNKLLDISNPLIFPGSPYTYKRCFGSATDTPKILRFSKTLAEFFACDYEIEQLEYNTYRINNTEYKHIIYDPLKFNVVFTGD